LVASAHFINASNAMDCVFYSRAVLSRLVLPGCSPSTLSMRPKPLKVYPSRIKRVAWAFCCNVALLKVLKFGSCKVRVISYNLSWRGAAITSRVCVGTTESYALDRPNNYMTRYPRDYFLPVRSFALASFRAIFVCTQRPQNRAWYS